MGRSSKKKKSQSKFSKMKSLKSKKSSSKSNKSKSRSKKSKKKSKSKTKSKSKNKKCEKRKCQRTKHTKTNTSKSSMRSGDKIPQIKAKGKPPPGEQPKNQFIDPERYTTRMITTFYHIPSKHFKTDQDVAKYNDYEINFEKQLGKGGFGTVFMAKNLKTGKPAAVKQCDLGKGEKFEKNLDDIKNELLFMEMVDKPYAIRAYCHYVVNEKMFIFMILADGGSFSKHVKEKKVLTETEAKYFLGQMCAGVENLHSLSIAHRDIKPDNFLMFHHKDKLILLLCDYGLSCFVHKDPNGKVEKFTNCCGTPAYMSPEILAEEPYNAYQVDVWALGVTLYYVLSAEYPFDCNKEDYGLEEMRSKKLEWKTKSMKDKPSDDLNTLIHGMLEPDVKKRYTMKQTCVSKWLEKDYKAAKVLEKELK